MLSIATLQSASQASSYYQTGDYYSKNEKDDNSNWYGLGAKKLGLKGKVDHDKFKNLLAGKLPDGTDMHKGYNKKGEQTHRPGYDLTFSAAKSASILAFKDPRIVTAHNEAVQAVLQFIENQACARVKEQGTVINKITKNLTVATFIHNVSRKLDPNLHTHCVVLNMTEIEGKWRSIFGDDYYTFKKSFGLQYRLEFAQRLMKLGYELEQTSNEGFYEIKGIPFSVLKQFSQRRQEIEHLLKTQELAPSQKVTMVLHKGKSYEKTITTVASSMANFVTRDRKTLTNIEQLKKIWDKELESSDFTVKDLENLVTEAKNKGSIKIQGVEKEINKAVFVALEHLTDRKTIFSEYDLLYNIKALCVTSVPNGPVIKKAIAKQIEEKILIPIGENKFTTANAIAIEKNNISVMQSQQKQCQAFLPIGTGIIAKILLQEPSKREALQSLLSSKDRFIAIDSSTEMAQQQLIKAFNLSTPNIKNYVIGPKIQLAKNFAANTGLANNAFSLNGFLYYTNCLVKDKQQGKLSASKYSHLWLIQRSHSLSNKEVAQLQKNAIELNARIIYLGDHMRSGTLSSGSPFRYLLDNNIQQIILVDNKYDALTLLREQKCCEAIEKLKQNGDLKAVSNRKERMEQAIKFIASNNSVLITQNSVDKQMANINIRKFKQQQGLLIGEMINVQVLIPVFLSNLQKNMLASYQVGDLLRFNQGIQNSIYQQGRYFSIVEVNSEKNYLKLTDDNNKYSLLKINNKTANKLAIYRSQLRELQVGDSLVWQDNTPKQLLEFTDFANSSGKIVAINENKQIAVQFDGGKIINLNLAKLQHQHIEYAYAKTLKSCVKQDFVHGVLLLNNTADPNLTLSEIYTALSAIKGEKKILCDNIELLKQNLINHPGLKEHAYFQKEVIVDKEIQEKNLSIAMNKIDGTLSKYHETLTQIVPKINLTKKRIIKSEETPEYLQAMQAVNFAITKLSEREAVFSSNDLLNTAKQYDIKISPSIIETAVSQAITEGRIISKGEEVLITKEVYAMECACLKIQKQGEGAVKAIITGPNPALDQIIEHKRFTDSQKQAILLAITSNDRVNLIQGVAGSGKTTMLKEIKRLSIDAGFELLGVANTASAKNNLYEKTFGDIYDPKDLNTFSDVGISSKTLASFLNQTEKLLETSPKMVNLIYSKNTVFILDEASLVSVRDMFAFLNIVDQLEARAIIVGDNRQLPAIEASRPFQLLLGKSNSNVIMNINTRLQTKAALQLMQDVYAARIDDAFKKLLDNLVEMPVREERLEAMAKYYLNSSKVDRAEIMPMLPLNADRVEFNNMVREGLKKEGTLTGQEVIANILVSKDLTFPETNYVLSFDVGDLVKFNHAISRLGINKGDLLLVNGKENNKVLFKDKNGNNIHWDPLRFAAYYKGAVEVYNKESRNLMVGDVIRWTRNDEERGIVNSETATAIQVKPKFAKVKLNNGNLLEINLTDNKNQHWDHAYGSTVHVVQGLDRRNPVGQGIGAAPHVRDISKVKVNDMIVIPGDEELNTVSKVGKVKKNYLNKQGEHEILAVDRHKNECKLNQNKIAVYPDFTKAKSPKISSLENFLVMATRGDNLVMFVDNIDGYKAALTDNQNLKQTALEIMLPEIGNDIKKKVQIMTGVVYGLADREELEQSKNIKNPSINQNTKSLLNFNELKKQPIKYDVEEIKGKLEHNILCYVTKWKGKPDRKSGREARWGKKGSFSVILSGPKMGAWADFEAGAAGKDLVSFYMHVFNLDKNNFSKVLENLALEVGLNPIEHVNNKNKEKRKQEREKKLDQEKKEYINKVKKLYFSSKMIQGTVAEKYLRKARGITAELPDNFRFKARCWHGELNTYRAALIVPGYDKDGKIQSVNRIYLDKEGKKINEYFMDKQGQKQKATAKRTYGPTGEATIKVNEQFTSKVILVTEGVENALSIKQVQPNVNIISSFGVGQLSNLTIAPNTKTIILCADNDGLSATTKKPMLQALQKWIEQGYQVKIAMPFGNQLENKIDFNDLLKQQGETAVSKVLNSAIKISDLSSLKNQGTSLSQDFLRLQKLEQKQPKQVIEMASMSHDKSKGSELEI